MDSNMSAADESMLDNTQQHDADVGGQEEQAFTIDPSQVEQSIKKQMKPDQTKNLDRVLTEGNKLLFGKDTHYQLMDGLSDSKDIPGDLGNGAFTLLMMLYKGGGYTMPTDIMDAVGTILLARACAFLSQAGMVPVTDDDYEEAVHVYTVKLHSTLDPSFKARMDKSLGQGGQPAAPEASAQLQQPQPGGILNQGVQP